MEQLEDSLAALITGFAEESGQNYSDGKFTGVGWLFQESGRPLLSMKRYEKSVNVYAATYINENLDLKNYAKIFGTSKIGKTCIRFSGLNQAKETALKEIIALLKQSAANDSEQ